VAASWDQYPSSELEGVCLFEDQLPSLCDFSSLWPG
jgi:hypothetical protein